MAQFPTLYLTSDCSDDGKTIQFESFPEKSIILNYHVNINWDKM